MSELLSTERQSVEVMTGNERRTDAVSLPLYLMACTSAPHGSYFRMIRQPLCGVVATVTSFPANTAFSASSAEAPPFALN